jgi:outer membrane receptor protein involved in Fe transport
MSIKSILLSCILSFYFFTIAAQNKITLTGTTTLAGTGFQGVIVELSSSAIHKRVLSDGKGNFKFPQITGNSLDTILLQASFLGYKTQSIRFNFPVKDTLVTIVFKEQDVANLKEVKIVGNPNSGTNAYKSVYKINSKDFIKNTTGNKVLATIPTVSIQNDDIIVDGRNKAIIFINGIESSNMELKALAADEIDKIEIIANPSASYNSDFTGSVINVLLKAKTVDYFKGSLSGTAGARNSYYALFPTLAYKRKSFLFTSYYSRVHNRQNIQYHLDRLNTDGDSYNQQSNRTPDGYQQSLNSKISFTLSEKSRLNFSNDFSGYKFVANTDGSYVDTNTAAGQVNFSNKNAEEKQDRWNITSVYSYAINPKNTFLLKGKYYTYNNIDSYQIEEENGSINKGVSKSSTREGTAELDYAVEEINLFSKKTSLYAGLKYINREFDLSMDSFNISQNVLNLFGELNTTLSKKLSSAVSLSLENTNNKNQDFDQNYLYFLPNVNLLYDLGKGYNLRGGYSKKIIRPSANNLNNQIVYLNPGTARQGNQNLKPQLRDYVYTSLGKKINNGQLSLRFFHEYTQDAIIETFRTENDVLISTLDNAAQNQVTGFSLSLTTKMLKVIQANLSWGMEYSTFENSTDYSIIKQNSGFTNRSNLNLSAKVFKDRLALSLYGFYNSPLYTLTTKTKTYPNLGFEAETNFFNNSVNINLSYTNMFALNARRYEYSKADHFNQTIFTRNNTSNLLLTVSYYFGKKFSSGIKNSTVDNEDIIVK